MTKPYKIEFNKTYLKDLKKIPQSHRKSIHQKITALSREPRPKGYKKLKSSGKTPLYRIRCGDYRVVYTIEDHKLIILIVQVGHRREIYRSN